jgi:hypothetical protein
MSSGVVAFFQAYRRISILSASARETNCGTTNGGVVQFDFFPYGVILNKAAFQPE